MWSPVRKDASLIPLMEGFTLRFKKSRCSGVMFEYTTTTSGHSTTSR